MKKSTNKLDPNWVKPFAEFMKAHDLVELEFKISGAEVKLKRASAQSAVPMLAQPAPQAVPAPVAASQSKAVAEDSSKKLHVVTSPFVGTFYRSPGPNQEPFVEVGKTIQKGDALCIVEAMKLMNEIESEVKGRIVRILVSDATPVEFGEPLFEVDAL